MSDFILPQAKTGSNSSLGWILGIAGLLPGLWQMLFGGNKQQETDTTTQDTTQTTVTPPWQPRDPGYNVLSPYLLSMLTQNMGRLSGAGFPGGKGIGGGMTQSIIDLIGKSWPDIMGNAGKTMTPTVPTETLATCRAECEKNHPVFNDRKAACLQDCQWKYSGREG